MTPNATPQITIHSASDEFPELQLTTFGTKQIYGELREVSSVSVSSSKNLT